MGIYFFKNFMLLAFIDWQALITFLQKYVFSVLVKRCTLFCLCCPLVLHMSNLGFEGIYILGITFFVYWNTIKYIFLII